MQPGRGRTPLFCCPGGGSFQTRLGDYYCQRRALRLSTCARCNVNPLDFLPFLFHLRNSSLIPWYLVSHCFSRLQTAPWGGLWKGVLSALGGPE